ncbi:uncharacterized protein [Dysidea avara]|uniref:uncharacterized protein isoform X3 n=1 Tax=Dysidea avara TaxID=196820 RepID=UPI003328ED9E
MCRILCISTCCITIQYQQQWINRLVEKEEVARKNKAEETQRYMEKIIRQAKRDGLTIKIRHAKVVFCGSSKAGKTSFSRLLRNIPLEDSYISTGVGDSKQVLISKVNVRGTDWKDLDIKEEIQALMENLISRVEKKSKHTVAKVPHKPVPGRSYQEEQSSDQNSTSSIKEIPLVSVEKSMASNVVISDTRFASQVVPEIWDILTLLDTGGQPEFLNILPAINTSAAFTFIVLNLSNGIGCLDQTVVAQHSAKGYIKHEMNYTNCHLLKCLLSSVKDSTSRKCYSPQKIMVQEDQHPNPAVCFIGTCCDKIKEQIEHVLETVDKGICEIVQDVNVENKYLHVWSDHKGRILFPVNNTTAGTFQSENSIAHVIRHKFIKNILQKKAQFEIPITWFILELQLRSFHKDDKKVCVSLDDVKKICDRFIPEGQEMEMEEIVEVLKFYHQLGTLLYFDEVDGMNKFVITDPQWLFCNLTEIVTCKFDDGKILDKSLLDKLRNKGILYKQLLDELSLDVQDIKLESFFNLLKFLKIIVPYDQDSFFMPSILPTCELKDINQVFQTDRYGKPIFYTDSSSHFTVEPLLIKFTGDTIPRGLFSFLVIQILQNNQPTFELYGKNTDTQYYRYSNLISLVINDNMTHLLSLIDRNSYLEIHVRVKDDKTSTVYRDAQVAVTAALKDVCEQFGWQFTDFRYGFLCNCPQSHDHQHLTLLSKTEPFPVSFVEYAKCGHQQPTKLENTHRVWFVSTHPRNWSLKRSIKVTVPVTSEAKRRRQNLPAKDVLPGHSSSEPKGKPVHDQPIQPSSQQPVSSNSGILTQRPDMWDLTKIAIPRIMAEWKNVAYCMRFDLHIITAIEQDSRSVQECSQKLFANWLTTNNGPTPKTWKTLLTKIKDVDNLVRAAEEIEEDLLKLDSAQHHATT